MLWGKNVAGPELLPRARGLSLFRLVFSTTMFHVEQVPDWH